MPARYVFNFSLFSGWFSISPWLVSWYSMHWLTKWVLIKHAECHLWLFPLGMTSNQQQSQSFVHFFCSVDAHSSTTSKPSLQFTADNWIVRTVLCLGTSLRFYKYLICLAAFCGFLVRWNSLLVWRWLKKVFESYLSLPLGVIKNKYFHIKWGITFFRSRIRFCRFNLHSAYVFLLFSSIPPFNFFLFITFALCSFSAHKLKTY